jgi:hypothetical protein
MDSFDCAHVGRIKDDIHSGTIRSIVNLKERHPAVFHLNIFYVQTMHWYRVKFDFTFSIFGSLLSCYSIHLRVK